MMPIMRDKSKDPVIDATDAFEKFQQEQRR
jgi:hypothetical protein